MLQEITKEGNALLKATRNSESSLGDKAYNMRYSPTGGKTFSDFSVHPRIYENVPWRSDGKKSDAAGAYQFLSSTWREIAEKYNLSDFSPANQDKGAWILAQRDYKAKTGKDLQTTLASGNVMEAARVLSTTWTSLPGGSEKNSATAKFLETYQTALNVSGGFKIFSAVSNPTGTIASAIDAVNPVSGISNAIAETGDEISNMFSRVLVGVVGFGLLALGIYKMKV